MNELGFWLATVIILLGASVLFILPILRGKEKDEQASRDELNKAFFFDRIAELKKEEKEGLIDNQDELTVELQQSLLDDIPQTEKSAEIATQKLSSNLLLPGLVLLIALSYILYAKVGNYDKVISWQNTVSQLPELSKKLNTGDELTDKELEDLILAFRTQMSKTPNDATGWLLLGRLALAKRDILMTEGAMEKAYRLDPNNSEIQLGYAQSMMLSGEEAKANQARSLLKHILGQDNTNLQALSLLAFDAFERQDFDQAIKYWSSMKGLLAQDDPRQMMLSRSIEKAQSSLNPVSMEKSVKVTISLDNKVKLPAEGVLVVTVHDENNSPMPVAAKLIPLSNFPLDVTLTDADSMLQQRVMSSLSKLIVKARIDTDGNVITKDGDWYGESEPFALGGVANISINKQQN